MLLFLSLLSNFSSNLRPLKSGVGAGSGPSPHSTFTLTHRLKPELQEVVLRSITSGNTNYSPFEKCTFFPHLPYISPPSPLPSCRLLSIYCFHFGSPGGMQSGRQKALLPALSQNELRSDSKRAAAAVAQAPKFREIFSCGVP